MDVAQHFEVRVGLHDIHDMESKVDVSVLTLSLRFHIKKKLILL